VYYGPKDKRTRHTASQGAAAEVSSVSGTRRVEGRGLRYTTVRPFVSLDGWACRSLVVWLPAEMASLEGESARLPEPTRMRLWSDLLAPRGTVIDCGLGPAKDPACDCCSICCLLAQVS
jgi:hypothetical protein